MPVDVHAPMGLREWMPNDLPQRSSERLRPVFKKASHRFAHGVPGSFPEALDRHSSKPGKEFVATAFFDSVRPRISCLLNLLEYPHQRMAHIEASILELAADVRQSLRAEAETVVVRVKSLDHKTDHRDGALLTPGTVRTFCPAHSERQLGILVPDVFRQHLQLLLPAQLITVVNRLCGSPSDVVVYFRVRSPRSRKVGGMSRRDIDAFQLMHGRERSTKSDETQTLLKSRVPVGKRRLRPRIELVGVEERSEIRFHE